MTLPLVYEVAWAHPQSHFYFVTRPLMAQLLISPPPNLSALPYDLSQKGSWRDMITLAQKLHKTYPQAVIIDMHDVIRTKVLRYTLRLLGHQTYALAKPRGERKRLLTRPKTLTVPPSMYVPPMLSIYTDVLRRGGLSASVGRPILSSQKRIPAVGIAPFAQHKGKALPIEVLDRLLDRIATDLPMHRIILYGAPGREKEQLRLLAEQKNYNIGLSEAKGLSGEVEEIASLECMVSMDSANQHIASLVQTPVVSLWGATHPAAGFVAWGQRLSDCIGVDMACRPCSIYGQKPCLRGDYACLHQLDLDRIIEHIKQYTS